MMWGLLNDTHAEDFMDIGPVARAVLFFLLVVVVVSLTGCGTPGQIQTVNRHPPAADMVKMDTLPHQTDPSLGGIFQGYVNAAQQYRQCTNRLNELQDWVLTLPQ